MGNSELAVRGRGRLKTPISYYGGKQQLAGRIVKILEQSLHKNCIASRFSAAGLFFLQGNRLKQRL